MTALCVMFYLDNGARSTQRCESTQDPKGRRRHEKADERFICGSVFFRCAGLELAGGFSAATPCQAGSVEIRQIYHLKGYPEGCTGRLYRNFIARTDKGSHSQESRRGPVLKSHLRGNGKKLYI